MDLLIGFTLSLIISLLAYKKKSLDLSGALTALIIGTIIYVMGTYIIFSLLIIFFISSSVITKFKQTSNEEKNGRNFIQVIANSLAALIFSFIYFYTKQEVFMVAAAIGIAASTSDTWASEIGKTSTGKNVSIVNFKQVPKGESGGVSLLGTIASFIGSFFIGVVFVILLRTKGEFTSNLSYYLLMVTIAGFAGCLLDSYLGIFLQAKYIEIKTGLKVEKYQKNKSLKLISGIHLINNDIVNLLSTLSVAIIFAIILS